MTTPHTISRHASQPTSQHKLKKKNMKKWCWSAHTQNKYIYTLNCTYCAYIIAGPKKSQYFIRSHAVMCYYLNWWFIPGQLNARWCKIWSTEEKKVQKKSAKNDFGNCNWKKWQTTKRTYVQHKDLMLFMEKDIENNSVVYARSHLHASVDAFKKTPWNDWFQSMHEICVLPHNKRPIINIDNLKITYFS